MADGTYRVARVITRLNIGGPSIQGQATIGSAPASGRGALGGSGSSRRRAPRSIHTSTITATTSSRNFMVQSVGGRCSRISSTKREPT